uniref:Glycosyltransferase 8 domain containing 2 n=1 Tax=Neogobius melanostomus TaxID=47308 RepID=A0A8C6TB74_9GOBI
MRLIVTLCGASVNRLLVVLLLLLLCLLLHSALLRGNSLHRRTVLDVSREDAVIPVLLCASEERLGAAMATVNSIHSNTDAEVFFFIVTLHDAVGLTRQYIEKTKLKHIKYKILEFNPMVLKGKVKPVSARPELLHPLNFVRFYLPLLDINHKRLIYVDDDVIVQGDIRDLFDVKLEPGHAAAFGSDCDLPYSHEIVRSVGMQTTYMGFLDYRKPEVRDLGINPSQQAVTKQLEHWMQENVRYHVAFLFGHAPMLMVFHDKYTRLEPLWHVRHLGFSPDTSYPESYLQGLWERWFIPDPPEGSRWSGPERESRTRRRRRRKHA